MIARKKHLSILAILELIAALVSPPTMQSQAQETFPYNIYFGNLHSHTSYSDGASTPADAYQHAKNSGVGDFLTISDHAHMLDAEEWADTKAQADGFTDADFVAIAAFEFTTESGDLNTFDTEWFMQGSWIISPTAYYDYLVTNRPQSIVQWNHPSSARGGVTHYEDYSASRDTVVELMEIVNRTDRYEASYISALDAGWHIGPAAGQDNHSADWLTGLETRTAILATSLTQANIYDAIRAHRVYATENRNLEILYEINESIMGSIIYTGSCDVSVHIEDPDTHLSDDEINKVELIDSGGVVTTHITAAHTVDWAFPIPSCDPSYYFVRVTNAAGQRAWTAPIWVETTQYTLALAVVGHGVVTPSVGLHTYPYGTVVPLTATAHAGSAFAGWSGDLSGTDTPTTILMDGDRTVTATFALNTYTLTLAVVGHGVVTPSVGLHTYPYGTVVPLTATAHAGSTFAGWSGDLSGTDTPTTILMDGDRTVTATFALNSYYLYLPIVVRNLG